MAPSAPRICEVDEVTGAGTLPGIGAARERHGHGARLDHREGDAALIRARPRWRSPLLASGPGEGTCNGDAAHEGTLPGTGELPAPVPDDSGTSSGLRSRSPATGTALRPVPAPPWRGSERDGHGFQHRRGHARWARTNALSRPCRQTAQL